MNNPGWDPVGKHTLGPTALAALTLLECGVAKDDPAIQRAAAVVRAQAANVPWTYDMSLAVLFLDRLGETDRDRALIRMLAARVIAGQNEFGGWTYECPGLTQPELTQLLTFLRQNPPKLHVGLRPPAHSPELVVVGKPKTELPTAVTKPRPADLPQAIGPGKGTDLPGGIRPASPGGGLQTAVPGKAKQAPGGAAPGLVNPSEPGVAKKEAKKPAPPPAKGPEAKEEPRLRPNQLSPNVRNLPILSGRPGPWVVKGRGPRRLFVAPREDNSNTQFAMLALWAARRHGVPVERTLIKVHKRFLASQHGDGGWGYYTQWGPGVRYPPRANRMYATRPSMACVGLLGLAMGHGVDPKDRKAAGAPAPGKKGKEPAAALETDPAIRRGLRILGTWVGSPTGSKAAPLTMDLYALWSVERVAVLYNLKTIGGKDWYGWAAALTRIERFWYSGQDG
jgi:hypothetical protein